MEINQLIKAIEQPVQLVNQETKPSEIIDLDIAKNAISGVKISDSHEDDLKIVLKRIFLLVGLREHHLPIGEEKVFLHRFIFANYGNKTLKEFELAFHLAVKGQLDIDDAKVFDQFTCQYVAKIMSGYRKWISKVSHNAQTISQKNEIIEDKKDLSKEEMLDWINEWKQKEKININLIPILFYDFLVSSGDIVLSKKQKWGYMEKASKIIKTELHDAIPSCKTTDALKELAEFEKMENDGFVGKLKERILNKSKKLIVNEYLTKK